MRVGQRKKGLGRGLGIGQRKEGLGIGQSGPCRRRTALHEPEALEEGDVRRTTASASWIRARGSGSTSLTLAWGRNLKLGGSYDAILAELTVGGWRSEGRRLLKRR